MQEILHAFSWNLKIWKKDEIRIDTKRKVRKLWVFNENVLSFMVMKICPKNSFVDRFSFQFYSCLLAMFIIFSKKVSKKILKLKKSKYSGRGPYKQRPL